MSSSFQKPKVVQPDPATTTKTGVVKPDGTSITITADGTISAQGGGGGPIPVPPGPAGGVGLRQFRARAGFDAAL